jgi:hypothetical protein
MGRIPEYSVNSLPIFIGKLAPQRDQQPDKVNAAKQYAQFCGSKSQ